MRQFPRFTSSLVSGLLLSAAALAQTAYTTRETNVRAGPERDYPVVTRLAAGTPVSVTGCNEDQTWCEVIAEPDRGWAYAGSLEYPYENRRVVILHGPRTLGFPVVPFVVGSLLGQLLSGPPLVREAKLLGPSGPDLLPVSIDSAGGRASRGSVSGLSASGGSAGSAAAGCSTGAGAASGACGGRAAETAGPEAAGSPAADSASGRQASFRAREELTAPGASW